LSKSVALAVPLTRLFICKKTKHIEEMNPIGRRPSRLTPQTQVPHGPPPLPKTRVSRAHHGTSRGHRIHSAMPPPGPARFTMALRQPGLAAHPCFEGFVAGLCSLILSRGIRLTFFARGGRSCLDCAAQDRGGLSSPRRSLLGISRDLYSFFACLSGSRPRLARDCAGLVWLPAAY